MPARTRDTGYISAYPVIAAYTTPNYGRATGGIGAPTAVTISGANYEYLEFQSTGTLTVTSPGWFDYLLIGGGQGNTEQSPGYAGAGGGAGALVIGSIYLDTSQTVTIGAGSNSVIFGTLQQAGNTSIAATSPFTQTASGAICKNNAANGNVEAFTGSGNGGLDLTTPAITTIYGFNGGNSNGGGGGFGGAGVSGASTGNGGAGFDVSVFIGGSALFKASGGGGGSGSAKLGGSSLGNNGSTNSTPSNGPANTGCGGGGGLGTCSTGNGGSGIAYVRWKV